MSKSVEEKLEALIDLCDEVTNNVEAILAVVDRLTRDARLSVDQLRGVVALRQEYDALILQRRAHELAKRADEEMAKPQPDMALVVRLLIVKNVADTGSKQVHPDVVKAIAAASKAFDGVAVLPGKGDDLQSQL